MEITNKKTSFHPVQLLRLSMSVVKKNALTVLRSIKFYRAYSFIPKGNIWKDDVSLKAQIVNFPEPRKIINALPITMDKEIYWHFNHYADLYEQETFILKIKGGRVWGNYGLVITDKDYLLENVSQVFHNRDYPVNKKFRLQPYTYIDNTVAVLAAPGSEYYYHWMFDIIPRIALLEKNGVLNTIEKFVLNTHAKSFQNEMLERVGIDSSRVIISEDPVNFHIKAKELVVPSMPSYNGCPSYEACMYLRKLFKNEIVSEGHGDNIYIQRLENRTIINENEVLETLKDLNLKIVHPEKLSVAEQAKTFANAQIVVSAHGAGLTNIVFCNPGTVVIDIFSPQWIVPCYWILANQVNLKYSYLIGENTIGNDEARLADITVNIQDLKKLLNKLNLPLPINNNNL